MAELKHQVEGLLFSSGRAMSVDALASVVDADPKEVRKALKQIKQDYDGRDTALKIFNENDEWKMIVHDDVVDVVRRVVADTELSRPTMETLAVVAYHYPKILQSEVIKTRGGHAYDHIRELEEAGFITRAKEGRSFAIKLTEKFFEYFDIEGAENIRDFFKDVSIPEKEEQKKLGELDVVDVSPSSGGVNLDGLEVVDESGDDGEQHENPFMARELGTKPEMTEDERASQGAFLDELDQQINKISERNTEREEDETFQVKQDEPLDPDEKPEEEPEEEQTADDVIEEVRKMRPGDEAENGDAEDEKSALDEPLDLEKL